MLHGRANDGTLRGHAFKLPNGFTLHASFGNNAPTWQGIKVLGGSADTPAVINGASYV